MNDELNLTRRDSSPLVPHSSFIVEAESGRLNAEG